MKTKNWSCARDSLKVLADSDQEWLTSYAIGVHLVIPPDKLHRCVETCRRRGRMRNGAESVRTHMIAQALHALSIRGVVEKRKVGGMKNEYRITEKGRARLAELEKLLE